MTDTINKIKAKIKALSEKTIANGCTEAEALSAMNMVSKLLNEFNLNMSQCDLDDTSTLQKYFKFTTSVQYVGGGLLSTIASFCSVKVWYTSNVVQTSTVNRVSGDFRKKTIIDGCCFFGFEQDIQMAEYLYNTLNRAIYSEIQIFKYSDEYRFNNIARKSLTTSFEHGMNNRLVQRLNELKQSMQSETKQGGKNALVVVKDSIVESDYLKATQKLDMRSTKSFRTVRSSDGYSAGHKAGDRVNLSRPLNGSEKQAVIA